MMWKVKKTQKIKMNKRTPKKVHFRRKQKNPDDQEQQQKKSPGYFAQARSWADDHYTAIISSRKRYQCAFLLITGLCGLTVMGLCVLALKQTTELVVVHEGSSGFNFVTLEKPNTKINSTWAQTQADIAHYVVTRESYDPILYRYQGEEVNLLSNSSVQKAYEDLQNALDEPVHLLGSSAYRSVGVRSILKIDEGAEGIPLAKVDFTVTDHFFNEALPKTKAYTALIAWRYNGVPKDPEQLLKNWSGFQVIRYVREPISISTNKDAA